MDSMLRRQVPNPFSGQGSQGMVSPRPISVCAITTYIAEQQETTEEISRKQSHLGQMLRGQMLFPHPGKNERGILPSERRQEKTTIPMEQTASKPGAKEKGRYCEDTAEGGGERKNSTRHQSSAEGSPGIAERKRPVGKKRGRIPTADSRPAIRDKPNAPRYSRISQHGRGIGFQPSEVEERNGYQDVSEQRARAQKPQPSQGAQKSWAEVVRSGQVASWDRC